jgi:excisionase family DNA binding protein
MINAATLPTSARSLSTSDFSLSLYGNDPPGYLNIFTLPGEKSHLYQLTCKNQIPHYKPGGKRIYFDKKDLDAYVRRNRIESI